MTVDIDYPLATLDAYSQKGVLFIQDYLKAFCIENNFILKYPTKTAISFLENYGSKINMDYTNDLVNFFSLLYDNSVFCILAGFPAKQIYLNAKQTEVATIYLQGLSPTELNKIIEEAIQKLILELDINDNITINYILNYGKRYTKTLANALKTDDIKSIIILLEEEAAIPSFVLFRGDQLTDDGLRALTQDIMDCNDVNMKFDILRGATSCMEDFIDVLSANCLFGGEYDLLFNSLDKLELMLLAKAVFGEYDAEIQTKSFWKQSLLNAIKSRN